MVENKLVSKHIRMSSKIAEWYENKAKELGVSQTNIMVMALADYIKQDKTVDVMSNMQELMNQLEMLKETPQK